MALSRKAQHAQLLRKARKFYDKLAQVQGSETCAICGTGPKTRRLHIDHNHQTMRLRGLLCFRHNKFMLMPGVTPKELRRAADYLEDPPLKNIDIEEL